LFDENSILQQFVAAEYGCAVDNLTGILAAVDKAVHG
jgi:hypothetical protein